MRRIASAAGVRPGHNLPQYSTSLSGNGGGAHNNGASMISKPEFKRDSKLTLSNYSLPTTSTALN